MDVNDDNEGLGSNLFLKFRDIISDKLIEEGDVVETNLRHETDVNDT